METKPKSRRERPAKSALSRDAIVEVALTILRDQGLEKVTMRAIATALDTGAASLYVYVRDTAHLHAELLEALLADIPAPKPGRHWRRDLGRVTEAFLAVLMRYPEIARLTLANVPTGPNAMRLLDTLGGLLLQGGADLRAAAWGVDLLSAYVTATAIEHGGRPATLDPIGVMREAVDALDQSSHPHLSALRSELFTGEGLERFRWGLDAIVTGILR